MTEPKTEKFETEPLTEEIMNMKMMDNPLLARAINKNITQKWLAYIKFMLDHRRLINWNCVGKVRSGKCLRKGSKVLLSSGAWQNVEDVKIGDKVISPQKDGTTTFETVLALHNPIKEIFGVYSLRKGNPLLYACAADHEMPLHILRTKGHEKRTFWTETCNVEAQSIAQMGKQMLSMRKAFASPEIAQFEGQINPHIDAYTLGVFLGNGTFSIGKSHSGRLAISCQDFVILEKISKKYPVMSVHKKQQQEKCADYDFSLMGDLAQQLRDLGLAGHKAGDKFIPIPCLTADATYRRELLAGLLDTDGTVDSHGGVDYSTKSSQLAQDVKALVFSLGGFAAIREDWKNCQSFKEKRQYFRVSLNFREWKIPMLCKRKTERLGDNRQNLSNIGIYCESLATWEQVYGFEISGESRWFVTDNWMVTHNSWAMVALCVVISRYSGVPFGLDNILSNQSQYLNQFKTGKPNELFLVDEFEVSDSFGMGATAEFYQQTDTMRIAAKRILHRINLVGEETSIGTNADYTLATVGIDYENFATKLLVYRIERGTEIPIGYIIIPVAPILCQDILEHKTYGCLGCPKYDTDECQRWFPKGYEKRKDINIKRLTQENYNFRTRLRVEIARDLLNNPVYCTLKKKAEMTVFVRNMAPRFTNRVLTEKEIEEIVTITKMAQKEGDLLNEMEKAVPPLVDLETGKPMGESDEDDAEEQEQEKSKDDDERRAEV